MQIPANVKEFSRHAQDLTPNSFSVICNVRMLQRLPGSHAPETILVVLFCDRNLDIPQREALQVQQPSDAQPVIPSVGRTEI